MPSLFLLCALDNALALNTQEYMVFSTGIKDVARVEAGHVSFAIAELTERMGELVR